MNTPMDPRNPRSEAGFALIEVIVAAAVLAIVALAVLSGIDGATGASTREKARAVAANLAEQDQERLRSMPVELLKNPPQTGDTVVNGVTYNVKSEAKFITDDLGGEPVCGSNSTQVQYLHIVTTVTSAVVGKRIPPVTVDSLVSPDDGLRRGPRRARSEDRRPDRHEGRPGHHRYRDLIGLQPAERGHRRRRLRGLRLAAGRQLHADDQPGRLPRPRPQPEDPGQRDGRPQDGQLRPDAVRPGHQRPGGVQDPHPRQGLRHHRPEGDDRSQPLADQRRQRRHAAHRHPVDGRRPRSTRPSLYPYTENSYAFFAGECGYASPGHLQAGQQQLLHLDEHPGDGVRGPGAVPAAGRDGLRAARSTSA